MSNYPFPALPYNTTTGPSPRKPCDKREHSWLEGEIEGVIQTQIYWIKFLVIQSVAILHTGELKSYPCRKLSIPWYSKSMLRYYLILKTLQWQKHTGFQNSDLWSTSREDEHLGARPLFLCFYYRRALSFLHPMKSPTGYFSFYGSAVMELTQNVKNFSSSSSFWENSTSHRLWLVVALAPRKHDLITAPKLKWLVQEAALAFHQLWFAEREEK